MQEHGRVAVVTGGSRGIGAVTSVLLARQGWSVCVGYRTEAAAAESVVAACEGEGQRALAVPADMADDAAIAAMFEAADTLGPLGVLVNNAGIVGHKARVDEISGDRLRRMMAVNVVGPFLCAAAAVPRMSTASGGTGGVIVNVSSVASRLGGPGEYVDYAASKGAIDTFTVGLAKEVATQGIRVVGVRPGLIFTEIHASGGQPDRVERLQENVPMGRGGRPEEIARTIAWLCTDEASYVTGSILDVSGGR